MTTTYPTMPQHHFSQLRRRDAAEFGRRFRGFTLLEVMVALTITLILMGLVVEVFSRIGKGVNNSRANMELNDQLRNAKHRLIQDLRGATCPMTPPLDPFMNLGYFEYVEGPRVASSQIWNRVGSSGGDYGVDLGDAPSSTTRMVNSTIGDTDDLLMFTTSSFDGELFVGKGGTRNGIGVGIQSRFAEVAWFLRRANLVTSLRNDGHAEFFNLHRRTWLIMPDGSPYSGGRTYAESDISMRPSGGSYEHVEMPPNTYIHPKNFRKVTPSAGFSTLGDLTMRERRSIHKAYIWPYEMMYVPTITDGTPRFINSATGQTWGRFAYMSLPTLAEQSNGNFPGPAIERTSGVGASQIYIPKVAHGNAAAANLGDGMPNNAWDATNGRPFNPSISEGARIGEDIILTNVVSFDIKAWDPGAPVFAVQMADASSASANPIAAVLVPGDAGYIKALDNFIATPGAGQPVGFGAYADLNYMGTDTFMPDAIKRWQLYAVNANSALSAMEKSATYSSSAIQCRLPRPAFAHPGEGALAGYPQTITGAGISAYPAPRPCVYDTWSTHYEFDGMDNDGDGVIDEFHNGADDNGNGLIDEPNAYNNGADQSGEQDAPPPYRSPLRGIKITIRVMEQESKQVREVTVVQEFVPL
jgi:prepilin-type N-terminal cleavage/methylation domain-containing protein